MTEKVIFERSDWDSGRYVVEVDRGYYGWTHDSSHLTETSAISRAEDLIRKGKWDTVRVIDTEPDEEE